MILLITPYAKSRDWGVGLEQATREPIRVATTLRDATAQLRAHEYLAVVIDQSLLEAEPDEGEIVLQHVGTAIPVYINFAICGMERVVRELRAALHRRKREVVLARQGAERELRNEFKGTLTALLLSCEMALQLPTLHIAAETKMRAVYELAQEMRTKLEGSTL
jgi:hypothetical protein